MKTRILFITVRGVYLAIFFSLVVCGACVGMWLSLSAGMEADTGSGGRLAIVIDDFGLQRKGVSEMLALDCKLTAAVMPFLAYSEADAEAAVENGKEVIIHIPMQATTHDIPSHLGPRPVTIRDSESDIKKWVSDAAENLPEAVGANIHMGTLSSSKEYVMRPLMEALHAKGMIFLDSKTSSKSVCRAVAGQTGIRFAENDVFLEHESKSKGYIKKRLRKAMKIAQEKGACIAIGHVGCEGGKVTAEAIAELLPEFSENGVQLVFLSELIR
ncbi:MAG: divergent polysaccharide deacetylase family protein [Ruminococcaceae bacterium]|nr:divergent polysaccharide deacetylase family protein [Oscillospiraceae bacterium]